MFPAARELFSEDQLVEMGEQMAELKSRLKKEFAARQAA